MKATNRSGILAAIAVVLVGGMLAEELPPPLNVPLIPQTNFFWCWAASGSMVTTFYRQPVAQCQFVSDEIPEPHCCDTGRHYDVCDRAGLPNFSRYHFAAIPPTQTPLEWPALVKELAAGRPFLFTLRGGPVNHMLVVRGVRGVPGAQVLLVNDPDGQLPEMTYDGYRSQHGVTIGGISPVPRP